MRLTPDEQQSLSRLLDRPVNDANGHALIVAYIKELQRVASSKKLSIDIDELTETFDLDGAQVAAINAKVRELCRAAKGRAQRPSELDPDLNTRAAGIYGTPTDDADDLDARASAAYGSAT